MREAWCVLHDTTCTSKCDAWCVKVLFVEGANQSGSPVAFLHTLKWHLIYLYINVWWAKFRMTIKPNLLTDCVPGQHVHINKNKTLNAQVLDPWDNQTKKNIFCVYYHPVQELELDSKHFQLYFWMTREQLRESPFHIEPLRPKVNRVRETINAKATFCYTGPVFEVVVPG